MEGTVECKGDLELPTVGAEYSLMMRNRTEQANKKLRVLQSINDTGAALAVRPVTRVSNPNYINYNKVSANTF